jgi:C-methyltransferase
MSEPQPHEIIWNLTTAYVSSRCLHVVAELGVADQIADEPLTAAELAVRCDVNPAALDRVLQLLAAHGIFERAGDRFGHTAASQLLRSDQPMSMRAFPRAMGLPIFWKTLENFEHSVRTGSPAVEAVEPAGIWAYFEDRPRETEVFGEAMTAKAGADIASVLGAYDFSRFNTVADIGGGRGHLLAAVLDAAPSAQGILFDLPEVVNSITIKHDRLTPLAGDFFADPLPPANVYLLMEVLHDWADEKCRAILGAIRRAAPPGAKVLVIENVLSDDQPDPRGHILDVIMMANTGGRERTQTQLADLFDSSGFHGVTGIETAGPMRIVETSAA